VPAGQDFTTCVMLTHASWMINQGVFSPGFTGAQQALALAGARRLGYELYVANAQLVNAGVAAPLSISLHIENTGVAPFYYNWPVELGVLDGNNDLVQTWSPPWRLASVLPGTNAGWNFTVANPGLAAGSYTLLLRVLNPLTNGVPLVFANQAQNASLGGWLTLGQFAVTPYPSPPRLSGSVLRSGFQLQVSGAAPGVWIVQDSSNFTTWTPLLTTNTSSAQWDFTDGVLPAWRFYRLLSPP